MCLCSRQSLQCHFLLELGTVTPSLMYLFVLHIRVLVDYTHACCATQAKGGLCWCPKFRGHYTQEWHLLHADQSLESLT